jgi:hypothetical protein
MLLLAAGAKPELLGTEDVALIHSVAQKFSYSELLRIANLLMRDDDVVNRAEHQRLAVEIALLKAATFPRLRAVEEVLSGGQPPPAVRREEPKESDTSALLQRVQKARPAIAGYLANARSSRKDDLITFTFNDTYSAEAVIEAREALEAMAREVYGAPVTIAVQSESKPPAQPEGASPLREDPVFKAFHKHLGGEVVEGRRSK